MSALRYLPDVVTLQLHTAKCTGCGMCREVCPHGVFVVEEGVGRIADRDACMECGACARNCPFEAITVEPGVGCATALLREALSRKGKAACGREPGRQPSESCCRD